MTGKTQERLLYLISPIGLIVLWQVLLMAGIGDRRFVPAPSDIAWRYWEMVASGELAKHTVVTLWRVFAGFFLGSIPGIAVGLLMAMFRPVRIFFDPLIASLFPIPKIALMPLLLLAFGFGDASKIALVVIAVFFPVVVNTASASPGCPYAAIVPVPSPITPTLRFLRVLHNSIASPSPDSFVYLGSPQTVAASAVQGVITDPRWIS